MSRAIPLLGAHDHADSNLECEDLVCLYGTAWATLTRRQRRWIRRRTALELRRRRRKDLTR